MNLSHAPITLSEQRTEDQSALSKNSFVKPLYCNFLGSYFNGVTFIHYENTPMQHTAIFHGCKNYHLQLNFFDYFHVFAQNIDRGYTLELPQ